jgi:hypothetical protein
MSDNHAIYTCQQCLLPIEPYEGYLHSEDGLHWSAHHRDCADLTNEYCLAVPRHWSDLLSAHHYLSQHRKAVH